MIFWVALFLASTFAFTVLFEHGTLDYSTNAQNEWTALMKYYHEVKGTESRPLRRTNSPQAGFDVPDWRGRRF